MLPYLDEDEIQRAKSITFNIQDKLNAVICELNTTEKPHKRYLKEKLDIINTDLRCLLSQVNDIEEGD